MSSKLVATVTGPADKDALSTFTRTVMGQGVTLGSSRSMEVSGTLSIASVLFLPDKLAEKGAIESVSALQWALQANLAGFICSVRPARVGRASRVIARVHVTGAERMGILAELASHCESRGVRVATMRTQTDSSRYGADGIEGNDDDDEPLEDVQTRENAVAILQGVAAKRLAGADERPFFVAVGFRKPHLPFVFPKRFLDFYPPIEETALPTNPDAPEGMPRIAWSTYPEVRHYDDVKILQLRGKPEKADRMPNRKARELRRAYYAAVSFADSNVGHVLTSLGKTGLEHNTVVVVFSDHGWSLGEHGEQMNPLAQNLPPTLAQALVKARALTPTRIPHQGCGPSTPTSTSTRARRCSSACRASPMPASTPT